LHKHPDRVRSVDVGFGQAHVFYPEATAERCTATLLVEVDPVALSRRAAGGGTIGLEPYVNDRPYTASSLLSVAIGRLFGSALAGSCETRPELVDRPLELTVHLPAVAARGGSELVERLFAPLGYRVAIVEPDEPGPHLSVELTGTVTVRSLLEHLYVLLPVLDDRKHYWIGRAEVDKLLRRGEHWLGDHPEAELITRRYLRFGGLAREALRQLHDGFDDPDRADADHDRAEAETERPLTLNQRRLDAVTEAVVAAGGGRVVDLGCGEGRLLQRLLTEPAVTFLCGVDASIGALDRAERRLKLDQLSQRRRDQVQLLQGALTYLDKRLEGFDVATVVEVIEHLDPERVEVFTEVLFAHLRPSVVVVTTPNREYNTHFDNLWPNGLRHGDHRFEWTRHEFGQWCAAVADTQGYEVARYPIGEVDPETGPPTQMAVFRRGAVEEVAA
jgi:3' terminal RNA ribose 2'-O-methyltransferase Hen1